MILLQLVQEMVSSEPYPPSSLSDFMRFKAVKSTARARATAELELFRSYFLGRTILLSICLGSLWFQEWNQKSFNGHLWTDLGQNETHLTHGYTHIHVVVVWHK